VIGTDNDERAIIIEVLQKGREGWNDWRSSNHWSPLDLSGEDLSGINLRGYDLTRMNLSNTKMTGCDLMESDLRNSDLSNEFKRGNVLMIIIKKDRCIGCGLCVNVCPEGFEIINKTARVKDQNAKCISNTAAACPKGAIILDGREGEDRDQNTLRGMRGGRSMGRGRGMGWGKRRGYGQGNRWR